MSEPVQKTHKLPDELFNRILNVLYAGERGTLKDSIARRHAQQILDLFEVREEHKHATRTTEYMDVVYTPEVTYTRFSLTTGWEEA